MNTKIISFFSACLLTIAFTLNAIVIEKPVEAPGEEKAQEYAWKQSPVYEPPLKPVETKPSEFQQPTFEKSEETGLKKSITTVPVTPPEQTVIDVPEETTGSRSIEEIITGIKNNQISPRELNNVSTKTLIDYFQQNPKELAALSTDSLRALSADKIDQLNQALKSGVIKTSDTSIFGKFIETITDALKRVVGAAYNSFLSLYTTVAQYLDKKGAQSQITKALDEDTIQGLERAVGIIKSHSDLMNQFYGKDNFTILMASARLGRNDLVQDLINGGADVNTQNPTGLTALMVAARNSRLEIVKTLMQAHADAGIWVRGARTTALNDAEYGFIYGNKPEQSIEIMKDLSAAYPQDISYYSLGVRLKDQGNMPALKALLHSGLVDADSLMESLYPYVMHSAALDYTRKSS